MAKYKEINMKEFYNRLKDELGVSIRVAREIHKGYIKVYQDCLENGESFPLPAIGYIELHPFKSELVRRPSDGVLVPRKAKYAFKYNPSSEAERRLRNAN